MTSGIKHRPLLSVAAALGLLFGLGGCVRGCPSRRPPIHLNPNMDDQPRYEPMEASPFFYNGSASQPPVPSTIARGELRESEEFTSGRSVWGFYVENPLEPEAAILRRGKERYGIYCTPCHGETGDGRGMLYERSKVVSGDLHEERIHNFPDGRLFEVITKGQGMMPGYRFPIPARDRWAIVAYVRDLQERKGSLR